MTDEEKAIREARASRDYGKASSGEGSGSEGVIVGQDPHAGRNSGEILPAKEGVKVE